jgi:predicted enzyme related to lactoylglutathione lyase
MNKGRKYFEKNTEIYKEVFGVTKSKDEMGRHVVRIRDENAYKILVGNLEGRDHSENLGTCGWIILE